MGDQTEVQTKLSFIIPVCAVPDCNTETPASTLYSSSANQTESTACTRTVTKSPKHVHKEREREGRWEMRMRREGICNMAFVLFFDVAIDKHRRLKVSLVAQSGGLWLECFFLIFPIKRQASHNAEAVHKTTVKETKTKEQRRKEN